MLGGTHAHYSFENHVIASSMSHVCETKLSILPKKVHMGLFIEYSNTLVTHVLHDRVILTLCVSVLRLHTLTAQCNVSLINALTIDIQRDRWRHTLTVIIW